MQRERRMGAQPRKQDPGGKQAIAISHVEMWRRALDQLQDTLPADTFRAWFGNTRAIEYRGGTLRIGVENAFQRETLLMNYFPAVKAAVAEAAGRSVEIEFAVLTASDRTEPPPAGSEPEAAIDSPAEAAEKAVEEAPRATPRTRPVLKDSYTLDGFVVGNSNRIAHAAAAAVAEAPGQAHNPLFLYAESGLGKTHLLHGIAHVTSQRLHTICISAEAYVREFVAAIKGGGDRRARFQERYENADVLLVDDIHTIANAEGTQQEFFNVFNALHDGNRQIVLTSDMPPARMSGLRERLVTRFQWGLVVEIEKPDLELREAILAEKGRQYGLSLEEPVLRLMAERAPHNVRELESALSRVRLFSEIEKEPITAELTSRALENLQFEQAERKPPEARQIIEAASAVTQVPIEAFTAKRKDQRAARARHIAMYLIREHLGLSYKEIGAHFGGRDHTTVLHGWERVTEILAAEPSELEGLDQEVPRMAAEVRARLGLQG